MLSDSIFRHVGGDCPKVKGDRSPIDKDILVPTTSKHPPITAKKIVIPGADCPRLFAEAARLEQFYTFDRVICHVGTNYSDVCSRQETTFEIQRFLSAIQDLFDCDVSYSPILPKISRDEQENRKRPLSAHTKSIIEAICEINAHVYSFCDDMSIDFLTCDAFIMDPCFPQPRRSLFAYDGTHLFRQGVVEMEHCLFDHLTTLFWLHIDSYFSIYCANSLNLGKQKQMCTCFCEPLYD